MRKFNLSFLAIAFVGLMICSSSAAPWDKLMTVKVPFAFNTAGGSFQAGEYEVLGNTGTHLILIRSLNGGNVSIERIIPFMEKKGNTVGAALVFNRYGGDYFLTKVLVAGDRNSKVLDKSRRESEIQRLAANGGAGGVQVQATGRR
jgi:hypothetical protein